MMALGLEFKPGNSGLVTFVFLTWGMSVLDPSASSIFRSCCQPGTNFQSLFFLSIPLPHVEQWLPAAGNVHPATQLVM